MLFIGFVSVRNSLRFLLAAGVGLALEWRVTLNRNARGLWVWGLVQIAKEREEGTRLGWGPVGWLDGPRQPAETGEVGCVDGHQSGLEQEATACAEEERCSLEAVVVWGRLTLPCQSLPHAPLCQVIPAPSFSSSSCSEGFHYFYFL